MNWIGDYRRGMLSYDYLNPPTWGSQWRAFTDEARELIEAVGQCDATEVWAELNDCVHSFLRIIVVLLWCIPLIGALLLPLAIMLPVIGFKTAKKHALRFRDTGCIRSSAHCLIVGPECDHICGRGGRERGLR